MNTKKQIFVIFLVLLTLIAIVSLFLQNKLQNFQTQEYIQSAKEITKKLDTLIEDKRKSALAIAIALSHADIVLHALHTNQSQLDKKCLISLSHMFQYNTDYKNVWIQILNAKGESQLRTWTDSKGDSVLNARADLKELLKNPHPLSTISTGKFTISFKSIVPIYDNKTLLGFVEIITHFNSISEELHLHKYDSLLLVDKKYKAQLTQNISHQFIDDYYVANFQSNSKTIEFIKKIGLSNIINNTQAYMLKNGFFITHDIIRDIHKKPMAYYILRKNIHLFNYKSRDDFASFIHEVIILGLLLISFLAIIFYKRHEDIEAQKTYFQNIVDTASEIIIIIQKDKAIDVNKAFFDFFHEYKTLKEFHNNYNCICDLFVEEDGFISTNMNNLLWFEYVYEHPKQDNKVKILHQNRQYIFTLSVQKLSQTVDDDTYTLALSDITQMEKYKDKLEHISQTDTLTQIANRAYFTLQIEQEFTRAKRYKSDLSLVMLDIDFFKKINDTFGHDIGDKALIALTKEVQLLLRNSDVFCRYGGEEFMIIMPETSVLEANISAQRIRKHIETLQIPPIEKMTISLGITQLIENDTIMSFIKRVDEALYTSKENGRNRATIL